MPRPRSELVQEVKTKLVARLRDGLHRPGQRFFSNRALVRTFGISYQTAHRLIAELEDEGWLARRSASGTYVAGRTQPLKGVELLFHRRAQRPESFGYRLLEELRTALQRAGVPVKVTWVGSATRVSSGRYPILWECRELATALALERRYLLLLNDRPAPGLTASFVDSVSTDDFCGGAAAGELLRPRRGGGTRAVLAGPADDERSRRRTEGFLAVRPEARVVVAGSWYLEDAMRVAPRVLRYGGVFCCNDRLAVAVLTAADEAKRPAPRLIGFDDAPVSERLNFTTIAIPWAEIVAGAVDVAMRRLGGDHGAAAQLIFAPRPVMRGGAPSG